MRGATARNENIRDCQQFQSTLLMRGATPRTRAQPLLGHVISIHAPHARSDVIRGRHPAPSRLFQSTLLMRGATRVVLRFALGQSISIHAPHARSDAVRQSVKESYEISIHAPHARSDDIAADQIVIAQHFNPRSSCEERQKVSVYSRSPILFQSTLLMRGAT